MFFVLSFAYLLCAYFLSAAFVFFNATATTEIYTYCHTLSLHDALPICGKWRSGGVMVAGDYNRTNVLLARKRSYTQTIDGSTSQIGRAHVRTPVTNAQLVCRLLLEKKNKIQTPDTQ